MSREDNAPGRGARDLRKDIGLLSEASQMSDEVMCEAALVFAIRVIDGVRRGLPPQAVEAWDKVRSAMSVSREGGPHAQ